MYGLWVMLAASSSNEKIYWVEQRDGRDWTEIEFFITV